MDPAFLAEFRRTIDRAAERLGTFCDCEACRPTAPGKWSKKEIHFMRDYVAHLEHHLRQALGRDWAQ